MADRKALQAEMISGHSGASPGLGMQRDLEVCKLVDTTPALDAKRAKWRARSGTICVHSDDLRQHVSDDAETRWNSGTSSSSTSTRIPMARSSG